MPTLVIDNVPVALYERILRLAESRRRTVAEIVLEVLDAALPPTTPARSDAPVPSESFTLPRPNGKPTHAVRIPAPLPTPHDLPDEE